MFNDRSCASSMMIVSYLSRYGSPCVSASRMPSVISLTYVFSDSESENRTLKPTIWPSGESSSSEMRFATVRAAIRRGCVWPINPATPRPNSRQIFGSCVVFPDPVSPHRMIT